MIVSQIENAIIDRLKAASALGVFGYTLRTVETLPTDLDERLPQDVKTFPAAWVAFGGWPSAETLGDGEAVVQGVFTVIVAASSLRNERHQRHGAGAGEPGSYQLAMDAIGLLQAQDFGLPISELQLGSCTPLYTGQLQDRRKCSLFGIRFGTRFTIAPSMPGVLMVPPIGDFATFAVGWDVPPHAGAADLTDEIPLPQEVQDDG